jgi:hypothetical protein
VGTHTRLCCRGAGELSWGTTGPHATDASPRSRPPPAPEYDALCLISAAQAGRMSDVSEGQRDKRLREPLDCAHRLARQHLLQQAHVVVLVVLVLVVVVVRWWVAASVWGWRQVCARVSERVGEGSQGFCLAPPPLPGVPTTTTTLSPPHALINHPPC